MGESCRESRDT